ncbi:MULTISPECIES: amino acid permease [Streptococcus]|uniref:Amino acid permease n=1 Tax=Streptococcus parasanguinis TaxID=1318 RepID=A0AAE8DJK6_STRPA|nr:MULTISPECIES: amino acid permease [Streptococcus]MCP8963728.1 amino acid permease [Streptococcus sp. CF8_St5-12]MCP8981632.1 amino acid permease [Streptococcus sp. CF8_St5-16]MCP8983490.1 amino acid permease [Streptococcus sp. CF8_St5-13]MCP9040480.1 amino acid permease [Streptococcus sp. CF8_St5-11]RHN24203.1 amino acid permease [Streptococcus parasanguinis]
MSKKHHPGEETENGMVRGLQNRHVQLIAIAGTIGTGLFLGAGRSLSLTGPSIILVYMLTGAFMYFMMRAIGEMLYMDPDQHTFINFITKYLGKGWGYFSGWSYWVSLVFLGMAEITAVSNYVQLWFPNWPAWQIQIIFLALLSCVNLIAVKVFGEVEFWFGMIKIVTILALIATGIFMVTTNFETPAGHASLSNITNGFQMFPNGWVKFVMAFQMVFFAYQAIEFVGITTSETANPRQVLPKAIKEIPIRIVIFYVGALLAIMAIFPWQQLPVNKSPFVTVFQMVGIKWAAGLINFVVLTAAASSLNSTLYSTGRHLYQIAKETPNSKVMNRLKLNSLSRMGIPSRAIIFSAIVVAVSAFINVLPGVSDAFALITASSSGVYIAIYILTMLAHLKYRKSKEFMPDGFVMPAYKVLNPLTIVFFLFVFVCLFLQESTYIGAVGATIWIILFGIYSNWKHNK